MKSASGKMLILSAVAGVIGLGVSAVHASSFSQQSLVVMELDNSAASGVANDRAVGMSLHEYALSDGHSIQNINLSSGNTAFSYDIGPNRDGILQRSQDGRFVAVGGYNVAAGTLGDPATSTADRMIVRLGNDGVPDYSTHFHDNLTGSQLRSVASADGSGFYATSAGNANSLAYVPFGGTTSTVISTGNWRATHVANGQLFTMSGSSGFRGIMTVGSGLPTTSQGGAFTTITPAPNPASGPGVNSMVFADANTIYAAGTALDAGGGDDFREYRFNGTSWVIQAEAASPEGGSSAYGVAAIPNAANASLFDVYLSTSAGIYKITDDPTDSTFPALSAGSRFVNAPAGTIFRGLAFSPVPEPATLGLLGLVGGALSLVRRRR